MIEVRTPCEASVRIVASVDPRAAPADLVSTALSSVATLPGVIASVANVATNRRSAQKRKELERLYAELTALAIKDRLYSDRPDLTQDDRTVRAQKRAKLLAEIARLDPTAPMTPDDYFGRGAAGNR